MFLLHLTIQTGIEDTDAETLDTCIYQVAQKSDIAFAKLYKLTSDAVYGFALSVLKNTHDAEDVLQDCFINIYNAAPNYRSDGKPMAWILTITRNLCYQRLRKNAKISDIPEEDWERYLDSKEGISVEDKMIISACMNILSDDERQIVILHAVAGFKHKQIAHILDMHLSTVLSKYNRALKKLKTEIEKEGGKNE
ncbi:MAG: RNA polymerase sigma factor [Ruminococcaceae bacterium]|nr:RNA polymerase sigma factor [Oscillospiraceae bacterium]